jgi:hypothetical protein
MTTDEARRLYAMHADEPRRIDLTTFCFWLALGALTWLLLIAFVMGIVRLVQFLVEILS